MTISINIIIMYVEFKENSMLYDYVSYDTIPISYLYGKYWKAFSVNVLYKGAAFCVPNKNTQISKLMWHAWCLSAPCS